jgi:hypothetical protein
MELFQVRNSLLLEHTYIAKLVGVIKREIRGMGGHSCSLATAWATMNVLLESNLCSILE